MMLTQAPAMLCVPAQAPANPTPHHMNSIPGRRFFGNSWHALALIAAMPGPIVAQETRLAATSWVDPNHEAPLGMTYQTFESPTAKGAVSYLVYLPPSYETVKEKRYPVVYWLHGLGGNQRACAAFVQRLNAAIKDGKTPEMIAIGVNGLGSSRYTDSFDGKRPVESVIVRDLVPHVDQTYRTIARREGRGLEGKSMGGQGSAYLGFKYPEVFGVVSTVGAAVHDTDAIQGGGDPKEWDVIVKSARRKALFEEVFGGNIEYFNANNAWTMVEKNADAIRGRTAIRIMVGDRDPLLGPNRRYDELLERLKIPHTFHVVAGAPHNFAVVYDKLDSNPFQFYADAFANINQPATQTGDAKGGQTDGFKWLLSWGRKGEAPGEFHSPIGIAIDKNDEILVTDANNGRVQRFNTDGKYLGGFDLPRDNPKNPKRRTGMAGGILVDGDGLIYVSFMSQHRIVVFTSDGKLVREWGRKGTGPGEFDQPGGMVFGPDGNLYICDQCNHRIQQFTREGKFLAQWGAHGSKPGEFGGPEKQGSRFAGPHFISLDSKGRLYTTEGCQARVQQFSLAGKPLAAWGNDSQEPGGFGATKYVYSPNPFSCIAVFVDPHDRVWVSSLNDRVQAFTPEGKHLLGIASSGSEAGQLARPHGMAMDSKGHLYVCDAGNERIQKFEISHP